MMYMLHFSLKKRLPFESIRFPLTANDGAPIRIGERPKGVVLVL